MKLTDYKSQVEKLSWHSVPSWVWLMVQNMGLDEEYDSYLQSEWSYVELNLDYQDETDLRMLDPEVIEKFNQLNEKLKEEINAQVLIDHDGGKVFVVTVN